MKSLLALLPYLRKYRKKIIFGYICILLYIGLFSIYPQIVKDAVDKLTTEPSPDLPLLSYAFIAVGISALGGFFLFLTRQNIIVVSREIENDIRYDFFSHLQRLSRSFFNSRTTGDLMAHATNDINNIRNFLGPGIMYSMQTFTRIIFSLVILLYMNVPVTLIAIAPLPFISYLVFRIGKVTYNRSLKTSESFSLLTSKVQEAFSGIRVIKSFVREEHENNEYDKISRDYFEKNLKLAKVQSFSFPMMFLLTQFSIILVLYFGGLKVIQGTMTYGDISAYIMYLGQLTWPMIAFGWIINLVQRAAPSMRRLLNIIESPPDISDSAHTDKNITEENIEGEIEFRSVSFKYPGADHYVLKNVSFKIRKGSTLGIIGHTGSGKSTLINLLPRIYDVTVGEILIDGRNIKEIPLKVLRSSIGIVPQESFLFSTTLEKNIAYSSEFIDESSIINSSQVAGLYKDVIGFPDKFKTVIGERGITLSGGQKQRTSLARAIYKRPKILILDDSLSAVDTNTEEEILNALKDVMKDRTSIIISHRISSIKNANNIIVLSGAAIKEEGTHNELLALKGIYYDLYIKQLLEEEIKETR
jgi:ATP-binding cassette subfamily B protein